MQRNKGFFHGRVRKTIAGLCLLGVVSLLCSQTEVLPDTAAFLLLICILAIATLGDMLVAILLSLVADAAYSWFLPPANSFAIEGPAAVIALATFLATAVIGSQLSVRAQRRAREAEDRNLEMERIHSLGRALLAHDTLAATGDAAVRQIVAALEASGAALFIEQLQRTHHAGTIPDVDSTLRRVFTTGEPWFGCIPQGSPRICVYPLHSSDHRIGALAIQSDDISETAAQLTQSLISVALERAAATDKAVEASAISRNEELRRALVDAFAHNLKTPLTSIKACTSALLRRSSAVSEDTRELLTVVDEETDRLTRLIADSLELVRVGERVTPAREFIPVSQPILAALADLKQVEGRQIETELPKAELSIAADPHLIQIVVTQLLDNALKYSPPDSPIGIKAMASGSQAVIMVRNKGAAIDEDERERIFDKFYRGRRSRNRIEGTGMGLAIARTIVESHGGEIEARNDVDGCIIFQFSLPLAPEVVMENVII